jgi:hypothetical protein
MIKIENGEDVARAFEERVKEYDSYLDVHIGGVKKAFEVLFPILEENGYTERFGFYTKESFENIDRHDESKYNSEEYIPYLNHFYPKAGTTGKEPEIMKAYDIAWNIHQKKNPHHWQYWVLVRDEGKMKALDMEFPYIVECLCDWHSFSQKDPKSTAYNWYQQNSKNMIFSPATRELVEELVEFFKEPLK